MTRSETILRAIANALNTSREETIALVVIVAAAIAVLVMWAVIQTSIRTAAANLRLRDRFQKEIRRLDLTVLQVDALEILAKHLNDRNKKYLLLSNLHTFQHCRKAAGHLSPTLDSSLAALEVRLGFDSGRSLAPDLARFVPPVGSAIKIEAEDSRGSSLARVVAHRQDGLTVEFDEAPGYRRGLRLKAYAVHASALLLAEYEVEWAEGNQVAIALRKAFAQPRQRLALDRALQVFVRHEGVTEKLVPTELRHLWSNGGSMENPDRMFRKRDDLQIVFRRNHAKWMVVNAEVTSIRKRRTVMDVRFSHLAAEARREILGTAAN